MRKIPSSKSSRFGWLKSGKPSTKLFFVTILLSFSVGITVFLTKKPGKPTVKKENLNSSNKETKKPTSKIRNAFNLVSFKKGDTPIAILKRYGFDSSDISKTIQSKLLKNFTLIPGEKFLVGLENQIRKLVFYHPQEKSSVVIKKENDNFQIENKAVDFDVEIQEIEGKINGSIVASIKKSIPSDQVAYRFLDAFVLDFKLRREVKKDAQYKLGVEKLYHHGQFVKYGEILSASLEIDDKLINREFVSFPSGGAFLANDNSEYHKERPFFSPVSYVKVTSLFKPRRRHPITKRRIPHMGIDLELPTGSAVLAPANAVVVKKGRGRGPGRYIVLKHDNGLKTYYNHLSAVEPLKPGDKVRVGEKIGAIGCTGLCTKPHLHFALKKNNKYVNPIGYLKSYSYPGYVWIKKKLAQKGAISKNEL